MKILVCVKVVKGEINPFDESALECALQLSDDVTVISMGPESCGAVLKPLTRLGVKKVLLISDKAFAGSDTLATSYILSTAIKKMEYDLILCGRQSVDGDTAQVGPMLAEKLDIPVITNAMKIAFDNGIADVDTRAGKETEKLPLLITVERGYVLRFPSIFSKEKDIEIIDNSALQCDVSKCGIEGSPTKVLEAFENETGRRKCKFITKDELFPLIEELMKQHTVVEKSKTDGEKLKSVWAVGNEVLEKAKEISEEVILVSKDAVEKIVERAIKEQPEVILWNADLWGRKNAPIAAAKLNTGLCADCTALSVDGENLIMYRPAQAGNITAKIKCITKPQMATVRTKTESSDIIVSGGKGVSGCIEKLHELALKLGAEIGASRGLVDMNKAPYENQIGLTGKTVSPKIYVAAGISGAIHHTCATEGSTTVIAINPDKDARIFEYADYGILMPFEEII